MAAAERGGGAGAAVRAKTHRPFPWLPGTKTDTLGDSSKAARQRKSFVRLDCPGAAAATAASRGSLTRDAGEDC